MTNNTNIPDEAVQAALDKCDKVDWVSALTGTGLCGREVVVSALTAALPHLSAPCAVEVKKLEWQEPTKETNGCWTAKCPIGTYSVVNENDWYAVLDEYAWGVAGFEWSSTDLSKDTRQTAFDAAQSDFERRILSCVVTKPVDAAAVRRQAFEEAAKLSENDVPVGFKYGSGHGIAAAIRALSAEPAQGDQFGITISSLQAAHIERQKE